MTSWGFSMQCDNCGHDCYRLTLVLLAVPAARYTSEAGTEVDVMDREQHTENWCDSCLQALAAAS